MTTKMNRDQDSNHKKGKDCYYLETSNDISGFRILSAYLDYWTIEKIFCSLTTPNRSVHYLLDRPESINLQERPGTQLFVNALKLIC
jgi:hypothetical protein